MLVTLWALQVLFLNTYYKEMKIREVQKIGDKITASYIAKAELLDTLTLLTYQSDVYIRIDDLSGKTLYSAGNFNLPPGHMGNMQQQMHMGLQEVSFDQLAKKIIESTDGNYSINFVAPSMKSELIAFGQILPNKENPEALLFIFSPLSPVDSTIGILKSQFFFISIISLIMAFLISILMSRKISKPILSISREAEKLAKGQFNVNFKTGNFSEIDKLAETLNYTAAELSKADTLHKDLIANVSHDLRTPLTMVRSYAELVRDVSINDKEKTKSHMQVIIDESDRLSRLVTDLLSLSKIQSGFEALGKEVFLIKPVISSILSPYLILEENEDAKFTLECNEDLLVFGDKLRIEQVLSNIISNAVKFTNKNKIINISATKESDGVIVKISDNGIGITEDELIHIWDRYYESSKNYKRDKTGSGLGLAITKEILELHKADFGIESKLNVGSTFWFKLPNKEVSK